MGTGGWIVIAIIVIQAVAAGITKIVEARKADASKVLKPDIGARHVTPSQKQTSHSSKPKPMPQTLQQQLEAVRQRRAQVVQTPTARPKPLPVATAPVMKPKAVSQPKPASKRRARKAAPAERSKRPPVDCLMTHEATTAARSSIEAGSVGDAHAFSEAALISMLADPDAFRAGLIFSELIAPPLALRREREV